MTKKKDPHAVALGRRGGRVGGKRRAAVLTARQRSNIARTAARARWQRQNGEAEPPPKRDAERTRGRIIAAAAAEFVAHGVGGARIERIARRASVNRRMLYHYFGGKHDLFREVLKAELLRVAAVAVDDPKDLADNVGYWLRKLHAEPAWMRLSIWEALSYGSEPLVAVDERRAFWAHAVDELRAHQRDGAILGSVDAKHLKLVLLGLFMFPYLLPTMTRLVTGFEPTDRRFTEQYEACIREVVGTLQRTTRPPA